MKTRTPHRVLPPGELPSTTSTTSRNLIGVSTVAFAIVLALIGTGSTYALLNSSGLIGGSSISSGSTSVTVNGAATATIDTAGLALLSPGKSIVAPLIIANTGSTPLSVFVSETRVVSQSAGLAASLRLRLAPAETCAVNFAGGTAAPLIGFTTTAIGMDTGATASYCLEISLAANAPASVQGGTAAFTLMLDANQVPR